MKLFYSPFHSFIHKVLVTAHEGDLWKDITFVPCFPFKNREGEDQGDEGGEEQEAVAAGFDDHR